MKIVIAENVTSSLQKLVKENCPDWIVHDSSPKDKKEGSCPAELTSPAPFRSI
jgi:hypothetical protein